MPLDANRDAVPTKGHGLSLAGLSHPPQRCIETLVIRKGHPALSCVSAFHNQALSGRVARMVLLLAVLGFVSVGLGVLVLTRTVSDIQLILAAVLLLGGFSLLGLASILGRVNRVEARKDRARVEPGRVERSEPRF